MKRIMTFLCAAVLVGAVGTMFAACEGEGDSEHGQAQEEPQLPPEDPEEPEEPKIPEELSKYDNYYWDQGEKIPVEIVGNKFYVLYYADDDENFKSGVEKAGATITKTHSARIHALDSYLENSPSTDLRASTMEIITNAKVAHVEGDREKLAEVLASAIYWAPYYKHQSNYGSPYAEEYDDENRIPRYYEYPPTERFSVTLKSEADQPALEKLAEDNAVEILARENFGSLAIPYYIHYHMICTNRSNGNALEMANLFYETGLFNAAYPSFYSDWVED